MSYDPKQIEPKWQQYWEVNGTFAAEVDGSKPKFYVLDMFPYPSGTGLHVGHPEGYTATDIVARYKRMRGCNVLHPMGWDAFGLPAEQYAIKSGQHPAITTRENIAKFKTQLKRIGFSYDWSREISTADPKFYRWTQWIFLQIYNSWFNPETKKAEPISTFRGDDPDSVRLAYVAEVPVNWCPDLGTVLANEKVIDGKSEVGGFPVVRRPMRQWMLRITAFADRLEQELDGLDWPDGIKLLQRNWIGRSEGAEITFSVEGADETIRVFTTRPDTVYGATYMVLAPEHSLVDRNVAEEQWPAVREYRERTARKSELERTDLAKEKTGVFIGAYARNPLNNERIPIWIADYVLMGYGTGAIMAVPAHDDRDHAFAERYDLPIKPVIEGGEDGEPEVLVNSAQFSGLEPAEGIERIVEWLAERGRGRRAVRFRLRDWSFSRQRYWGCPIPVVHCGECGIVPVPDDQLPVVLPEIEDYRPKGKPPLASNEEGLNVRCPRCGRPAEREADTMDTFVDSSWYFVRYCDPENDEAPWRRDLADFWMPVDQYIGGIDHATGHLLYSRFFMKALNDQDLIGVREPFQRLFHQGWVRQGGTKMSKSKGNVTSPDVLADRYGADAVRLYILFMGPADQALEWTEEGVEGIARFLRRLWRIVNATRPGMTAPGTSLDPAAATPLARKAHETIAKVTDEIGRRFVFNTPIAAVMELVNELARAPEDPAARLAAETAVSLIQPYAPHIAEELWERLGHERLWEQPWPVADESLLERETFELVVQVNGKVRDRFEVEAGAAEDELIERAKGSPRVQAHLNGKEIRRAIVVPGKLVNLVVG